MGCLFAIFAGVFPRLAVFILWIARPERVDAAFSRSSGRPSPTGTASWRP
jgi:hypothetical protein